jgi:TonB family protein
MAKRVLLIDYEPRSRERVRALLPASEFTVVEAHDGEEGLATFSSSHFDAVVLSGMLPRLPSAEVIREIRRKGGATAPPILLMVSGYKGTNRKADAQRVGAFDLLLRPFSDEDFLGSLRAAIESTDVSARTLRISTAELGAESTLTASDIFSDVLQDVGGRSTEEAPPPAPAALPRLGSGPNATEEEVERRLRDTLSGILANRAPRGPSAPSSGMAARPADSSAPPAGPARFSTDSEIDKMISDTLSGIKLSARSKPAAAPAPAPEPAAPVPAARPPEPPPSVSTLGPDQFGQYEILERIASGGMAELYKARRSGVEGFQKIVAIKKILPHLADNEEFITMFADEAKLAAQLNHPSIVHIFDLGKIEGGGYFIAMEYIDGRDLRGLLQAAHDVGSPLPIPLAVFIASKVAAALDYAHRRRDAAGREMTIVHRDVSPQNILISYEGDIKLCDFGIAKAASKASQTQSGALKGKVQYMSPEQAWGKPIDRRSDLFSLGAVLFEMLTDQKLFRGDSDLTVLEKVRAADVVAPSSINPEVPKNLDAILLKALAREAEERYSNASDMLRDLEAVLYAYTPAPGSADLAIFLHRLAAEEQAIAESKARQATQAAKAEPEKKRKSKGTPVARRTGSVPKLVVPSGATPATGTPPPAAAPATTRKGSTGPGVFGAFSSKRIEAEKRSRAPLYGMIVVACAALAGVAWWAMRKPSPTALTPVVRATPLPVLPTMPASASAAPTPAPTAGVDSKAIEEEVQRQLSARKKELQKAMDAGAKPKREAAAKKGETAAPAAAAASATETEAAPSPIPVAAKAPPTAPPLVATEPPPTAAPVRAAAPTRVEAPEVSRGDLVGPGPDVTEATLLSLPKVVYPPLAKQQGATGRVVLLLLVDEEGQVSDLRLQQGVPSRAGINEAVVKAARGARFRPATKNGVPVKMWRTLVVDVNILADRHSL